VFNGASSFNGNLENWDTGAVTDMSNSVFPSILLFLSMRLRRFHLGQSLSSPR
jgi:surface protein